jgi:hypothetical protein
MHAERTNVVYEFGPFRLEAREHRLVREGYSVRITGKALPYQSNKEQVMRWLKIPRNPARRISCDSAGHREAKPHGKELRHRWLRLAKK